MDSVVTIVTAVVVLVAAVVGYATKLRKDVREIHVMVNSRMSEALERIGQLAAALREAGIEPPDKPPRA